MANDFSGASNIISVYNFESGSLITDSQGSQTLTQIGTPTADTVNFKEGSASSDHAAASTRYDIPAASQTTTWPHKTLEDDYTICGWWRFNSLGSGFTNSIWGTNGYGAGLFLRSTTALTLFTEASHELFIPSLNRWYHISCIVSSTNKTAVIIVWDDTAQQETVYGIDWAGNWASSGSANAWGFMGNDQNSTITDGQMDEVVIANNLLTVTEVTDIRKGVFGAADTTERISPRIVSAGLGFNQSIGRIF